MNLEQQSRLSTSSLSIDDGIREFMLHQRVSRHTERTISWYDYNLNRFKIWLTKHSHETYDTVDSKTLRLYMAELGERMQAGGVHAQMRSVRALLKFLHSEELIQTDPTERVRLPKLDKVIFPPFTTDEIARLEGGCSGKEPQAVRNLALIYVLLDSGMRLSECSALRIGDVDPVSGVVKILGKGRKERITRIGSRAMKALTRYSRMRGGCIGDPLWLGRRGPMTRMGIAEVIEKLGKRVGVHAHPHKFRRTTALFMLRAGADLFSIQQLLGHSDLTVLRRYVNQTEADATRTHILFGPLDNM